MQEQLFARKVGSFSKLNTLTDGIKVVSTIIQLFKDYKPLLFFSLVAGFFMVAGLLAGLPVIHEFILSHYIKHVPLAILATGLMITGVVALFSGYILDTICRNRRESYELWLNRHNEDKSR